MITQAKQVWSKPMFKGIFLVASWSLWKEKNDKYFRGIVSTIASWRSRFKDDFSLLTHRVLKFEFSYMFKVAWHRRISVREVMGRAQPNIEFQSSIVVPY